MKSPSPYCLKFIYSYSSIIVMSLIISSQLSAQSSVIGLRVNNQNVNSAKVSVLIPGQGGNKGTLNVGDKLVSGTRLIIQANTIVLLQSAGGKQKIQSVSGKPIEYSVETNSKGENHTVKGNGAQLENTVNKIVGHSYKANNGRGSTASSHGTIFTFTDYSDNNKEAAKIKTDEGSITITDAVPVEVKGTPQNDNKRNREITQSVSKNQNAGDAEYTTSDQAIEYSSFEQALQAVSKDIDYENIDEETADDLTCIGDLYMDMNQPEKAVIPYQKAFDFYYNYYGNEDLTTLETQISLADALLNIPDDKTKADGHSLVSQALNTLQDELAMTLDDYNFMREEQDEEGLALICDDVIELYSLLGFAYDVEGSEAKSNEYYEKMEKGCE